MLEIKTRMIVTVSTKKFSFFHNYSTLSCYQWVETWSNSNSKWGGLEFARLYEVLVVTLMTLLIVISVFGRFSESKRNLTFQILLENLKLKSISINFSCMIVFMSKPVFLSRYFILISSWLCVEITLIMRGFILRRGWSRSLG